MRRVILTAITATAIALSPAATAPAKAADAHDILGAVLGLAAIAAIASNARASGSTTTRAQPTHRTYHGNNNRRQPYFYGSNSRRQPYFPTRTQRPKANVLPGQCLRVLDGRKNDGIVFTEPCLRRNGISQKRLPSRCESRLRTREGRLDVYRARCLADAGWTLPRIRQR